MYKSSTCNNWCVVCIGPTNVNSMVLHMGYFAFGHSKHPVCVCVVCTCACVICDVCILIYMCACVYMHEQIVN